MRECSNPTVECPRPELWNMHDDTSSEVEVLHFLEQLVLTVKPRLVVETGTHIGYGAFHIGLALKENGFGKLITCEKVEEYYLRAVEKVEHVRGFVDVRNVSSLELRIDPQIDILFSDSDPAIRMAEVEHFWDRLTTSSLILIHDVNTDCHKDLRQRVLEWDKKRRLSVVLLPTPRGLAICQKVAGR